MCSTIDVSIPGRATLPLPPAGIGDEVQEPVLCLMCPLVSLGPVYHEELSAPIRRNKEEPKARPLRVGDTEKPEPEREYSRGSRASGLVSTQMARGGRVWLGFGSEHPAPDHGHMPSPFQTLASSSIKWGYY
jgi:hypothetical protein